MTYQFMLMKYEIASSLNSRTNFSPDAFSDNQIENTELRKKRNQS